MMGNERKNEFAILRGMGASKKELSRIMMKEAFYICSLGSLTGAIAASCVLYLFGNMIRSNLSLPFLFPDLSVFAGLFVGSVVTSVIAGIISATMCVCKVSHVDTALVLRGDN
jgi:putative ABC transport system permease protein